MRVYDLILNQWTVQLPIHFAEGQTTNELGRKINKLSNIKLLYYEKQINTKNSLQFAANNKHN